MIDMTCQNDDREKQLGLVSVFTGRILSSLRLLIGAYLTILIPAAAFAETITLRTEDGDLNLTGEFLELTDGRYRIDTTMGELLVLADAVTCEGPGCPSEVTYVFGETVLIQTTDRTVRLSGILVDVVDDSYVVAVDGLGQLRLDLALTECSGPGCP